MTDGRTDGYNDNIPELSFESAGIKMLGDNFCCIFDKESFATNLIEIGGEIKFFEEFNFSPTLV